MSRLIALLRSPTLLVALLAALAGGLALYAAATDSVTFDETSHLVAGLSYLKTGDFRMAPDHPPLGKVWCAWPLLLTDVHWPPADDPDWRDTNIFQFGRTVLFKLNDGQHLVFIGRCLMVALLLATIVTVYGVARAIFGANAGLIAAALAALSPTLLAHGHLVTTDLPITLTLTLTLWTFARLWQCVSWPRILAAGVALTAACLAKLSWPLMLPALGVMAACAVFRRNPLGVVGVRPHGKPATPPQGRRPSKPPSKEQASTPPAREQSSASPAGPQLIEQRAARAAYVIGSGLAVALLAWAGIWTGYRWQSTVLAPEAGVPTLADETRIAATEERLAYDWHVAVYEPSGAPRPGVLRGLLRWGADWRLLPDAYLLGLAQALTTTEKRAAYLLGEYSTTGWPQYFPLAFLLKTPLPTLALILLGLAALLLRRARVADPLLLSGLLVFAVLYAAYVMHSSLNIGHRHLLPIYPVLFILAGGSSAWLARRGGRIVVGVLLVGLLATTLRASPHFIAYFHEIAGGPRAGWRLLADSNVDWGQDLLRLARWTRQHHAEPVKFAYFGSAVPTAYLPCESLPSFIDFPPRAALEPGTYVVSATQLLGVYDPEIRPAFWTDRARSAYAELARLAGVAASSPADAGASAPREEAQREDAQREDARREEAQREYRDLRYKRLLANLRTRPPDDRVGASLFIYRLTADDVDALTRP